MRRICVFCGSSLGTSSVYAAAADQLGELLAREGIGLLYGGGKVGLMGRLADAVLEGGGEVIGVIPAQLEAREVAHAGLTELRVVRSMHERKAMLADLADAFVALPGGLGTLEELFEIATWAQLGIHAKPVGILNVSGYFDCVSQLLNQAIHEGFIREEHRKLITFRDDPVDLLEALRTRPPIHVPKWLEASER